MSHCPVPRSPGATNQTRPLSPAEYPSRPGCRPATENPPAAAQPFGRHLCCDPNFAVLAARTWRAESESKTNGQTKQKVREEARAGRPSQDRLRTDWAPTCARATLLTNCHRPTTRPCREHPTATTPRSQPIPVAASRILQPALLLQRD